MVNATVTWTNRRDIVEEVTRGALLLHDGNVTIVGPVAFSVSVSVPGGAAGSVVLTIPVQIPYYASTGTFVSVGFSFLGPNESGNRVVKGLGGCTIEIVP